MLFAYRSGECKFSSIFMITYTISKHHNQNKSNNQIEFHITDHTTKRAVTNYNIKLYDLQNAYLKPLHRCLAFGHWHCMTVKWCGQDSKFQDKALEKEIKDKKFIILNFISVSNSTLYYLVALTLTMRYKTNNWYIPFYQQHWKKFSSKLKKKLA